MTKWTVRKNRNGTYQAVSIMKRSVVVLRYSNQEEFLKHFEKSSTGWKRRPVLAGVPSVS